jgi:sodium transport system permease protein
MSPWLRIYRKETRELFRDRRVVMGAFVMPILMIWLMSGLFSKLEGAVKKGQTTFEMGLIGDDHSGLIAELESKNKVKVHDFSSETEATKALKDGDIRMVLVLPEEGSKTYRTLYDSESPLSQIAMAAVAGGIGEHYKAEADKLLRSMGKDPDKEMPFKIKDEDIRKAAKSKPSPWMNLLPYLIVLWAFYGGFSIAGDLVAGEKEKGTLETLLVSPAPRREVVIGKWLALATCCLLSSMTSVLGLVLRGAGGGITLGAAGGMILVLIPLVLVFASILLMVSSFAKSIREAQTYLTLISFLVLMPAVMSQFVGITGEDKLAWVQWTPVLNSAMAMGAALKGSFNATLAGKAILVDLILAAIFLTLAWRHFHREQILNRT